MVNKFKFTNVRVARPNPMQICACGGFTAGQTTVENLNWASGPPSHRGCGPMGLGAAALWDSGYWAKGLLLAKPVCCP